MLAIEVAGDRLYKNGKGVEAPQMARLAYRKDPLHPALPFFVVAPLHDLAPQHGKAERPVELSEGITPPAGLQNRACLFRGTRLLS